MIKIIMARVSMIVLFKVGVCALKVPLPLTI